MIPILGLIIGILIGIFLPYKIPDQYSVYVAVGILAALDTVFGGAVAVTANFSKESWTAPDGVVLAPGEWRMEELCDE